VDTRLVADLIHYAAIGAFDAAVLISGDDDFVPAVEAVNALGRQVWVATWAAEELSSDLRVRCFGDIHLSEGVGGFRADRQPPALERARGMNAVRSDISGIPTRGNVLRGPQPPPSHFALERGVVELQRAEARLPHVSRGYFVTRWKSHQLPPAGQEREL